MKKAKIYLIKVIILGSILSLLININTVKAKGNNLNVLARCAVAMDAKTGIVLYEKNAEQIVPMASTTKIMTALVAIKYGNLDKKITISSKAASVNGSTVGFKKGENISVKELLYGLMLRSGNDAAIALAEGISGSVDNFSKLMNEYAVEIGLINSHFESPHGLDSNSHYSTAYDLALVTAKAKENPIFNEIVSSKDVDGRQYGFTRSYHNINKILWLLPNANGVKTGTTGGAGKCLVTSVNVKGNEVIIVVLNCNGRWKETKKIEEYVNKNYNFTKMISKDEILTELSPENGKENIKLGSDRDVVIPVKLGHEYSHKIILPQKIDAPIKKGEQVGSLCIYEDSNLIYDLPMVSINSSKEKNLRNIFKK